MLINKNFTYLFINTIISIMGSSLSYIAIYWSFANDTSTTAITLLTTLAFVSRFLFYMFLSPIVDRYESITLMRTTMLSRCVLLITFGALMLFWKISIFYLMIMIVIQTALECIYSPSSVKIIVQIVDKENQSRANALINLVDRTGILIGMIIGGGVIAFFKLDVILIIEGISFFIGACMLSLISLPKIEMKSSNHKKNYINEWKEGINFIVNHKWMLAVLGLAIASNIAITPTVTLLAPYSLKVLHVSSTMYSYLQAASILGSMFTAILFSKWKFEKMNLSISFSIACFLQAIFMICFGLSTSFQLSLACLFLIGLTVALFNIPFTTILQHYVPQEILGRVRSTLVAVSTGVSSIMYMLSGVMSSYYGIANTIQIYGGIGLILIVLIMYMRPFKDIEKIKLSAVTNFTS